MDDEEKRTRPPNSRASRRGVAMRYIDRATLLVTVATAELREHIDSIS